MPRLVYFVLALCASSPAGAANRGSIVPTGKLLRSLIAGSKVRLRVPYGGTAGKAGVALFEIQTKRQPGRVAAGDVKLDATVKLVSNNGRKVLEPETKLVLSKRVDVETESQRVIGGKTDGLAVQVMQGAPGVLRLVSIWKHADGTQTQVVAYPKR